MTKPSPDSAHVAILMATYNGAAHLREQLDSLAAQTHTNWSLWVGDDGSTDETESILEGFKHPKNSVTVSQSGGLGSAANFMSLLKKKTPHDRSQEWIAFADQDDVWLADKLERGVAQLCQQDNARAALYCSRTWVADSTLTARVLSVPRYRPPSFNNALVQNIAAGNTILLNPAAANLVREAAHEAGTVVMHDWWVYQLITGAGGVVVHDNNPTLLYRQHENNVIGNNTGTKARLKRISNILNGEFRAWNDINVAALQRSAPWLTPESRDLLKAFSQARRPNLIGRVAHFRKLGLYRQTLLSTLALWFAVILGRV